MFPRARDPDVFPPQVFQYSVTIPAGAARDPLSTGLVLPAALGRALPKRKIQFIAGRYCAREAIVGLAPSGGAVATLPQDADGCPVWPQNLVGSISHDEAFATAAVASCGVARGLGVDVEPVMSSEAAADLTGYVASADEILRAERAGLDRLTSLTLIFSAKESLFKALFSARRLRFDYLDCALARLDPGKRRFSIRLAAPFDAAFDAAEFSGRWELMDGEVRTGVVLPSS